MKVIITATAAKGFNGRRLATKVNDRKLVIESIFLEGGKPTEVELDETCLAWAKADGAGKGIQVKEATQPPTAPRALDVPKLGGTPSKADGAGKGKAQA